MGTLASLSGRSSSAVSLSDLDGYSFRDYQFPPVANYAAVDDDDFGFDPPKAKVLAPNAYQPYSPPADLSASGDWPEFDRDEDSKQQVEESINLDAYEMDKFISSTLPNPGAAVARFGQMTPPRSTSAASSGSKSEDKQSLRASPPARRTRGKAQVKEESTTTKTTTGSRKRKSTRKSSTSDSGAEPVEESKRKQSLEKNRLAAAKCRVNKKEKTDKLQRDSHEKAVENAVLKNTLMQMRDTVQQLNALLVAHASGCDGCNSPEEIRAHLNSISADFFSHQQQQHIGLTGPGFPDFSQMGFSGLSAGADDYFPPAATNPMINPPLPEFDRTADFEVHTPMQTD